MNVPPAAQPPPTAIAALDVAGRKIEFAFPDTPDMRGLLQSIFAGKEYPLVQLEGYEPDVIVDVGANLGAAALYFHLNYPAARIVCFEPSPASFAYMQRNLAGFDKVELQPWALSDQPGQSKLFVGTHHCMQNSMIRSAETRSEYESIEARRASAEFDRLGLGRVSILKLDTEGSEVPILRDLQSHLPGVDLLYIEYHSEEDRRTIDALLAGEFVLFRAGSIRVHRGSLLYLSRRLLPLSGWYAPPIRPG